MDLPAAGLSPQIIILSREEPSVFIEESSFLHKTDKGTFLFKGRTFIFYLSPETSCLYQTDGASGGGDLVDINLQLVGVSNDVLQRFLGVVRTFRVELGPPDVHLFIQDSSFLVLHPSVLEHKSSVLVQKRTL